MEFQHYFVEELGSSESSSHPHTASNTNPSACFDCSICLDSAHDPVVTLCGHLYCWPCIYKWFNSQTDFPKSDEPSQCPVCKSQISLKTMVPLYVHSQPILSKSSGIPPRPHAPGIKGLVNLSHADQHVSSYDSSQNQINLVGSAPSVIYHPTVKMFGEMMCAGMYGNPRRVYAYSSSYHAVMSSTPRLRRQQVQVDKSLNRVTIFLLCFVMLCLLMF